MNKYAITFGSEQLPELKYKLDPMKVILVIEAPTERDARNIVFDSFIGRAFCTSYPDHWIKKFEDEYNMKQYSLKNLEDIKNDIK